MEDGFIAWCGGSLENGEEPVECEAEDPADVFDESSESEAVIENNQTEVPVSLVPETEETEETPVVQVPAHEETFVIPCSGSMTFNGASDAVLRTVMNLLGNSDVHITIQWDSANKNEAVVV